jgi:hypothetical protein
MIDRALAALAADDAPRASMMAARASDRWNERALRARPDR